MSEHVFLSMPSCGLVVSQSLKSLCGLCICSRIFSKVPVEKYTASASKCRLRIDRFDSGREWIQDLIKIKSCFNLSWSVCVSRSMVHGSTRKLILYLWGLEQDPLRELNLELILFILALIPPALSSFFFSTLLVYILLFSFLLFCFSFTFSILLILSLSLLYSFHVASSSALARSGVFHLAKLGDLRAQ